MDKYLVIEIQTLSDGQVANIVTSHDTLPEAQSKFFTVCASAALTTLPCHAVTLLTSEGTMVDSRRFKKEPEPEAAPAE